MDTKNIEKYSYNRFGSKGERVGQAAIDLMSKTDEEYTVEEMLEGMGEKFRDGFEECVSKGIKEHKREFHVLVLTKKDLGQFGVSNVVRNFFINRKSAPDGVDLMISYPHHMKTLYKVDPKGDFTLLWSLPGYEDCRSIAKNPQLYDPKLVEWITQCFASNSSLLTA